MEFVSLFLLLLVIFSTSVTYLYFKPKSCSSSAEKLQPPPGSTGLPFIGETLEYTAMARKGCVEKFISDRQQKYSSKLFKTSYIGQTMVFLCNAEANKILFSNHKKLVKSWWPSHFNKLFTPNNPVDSEAAARLRKPIFKLLSDPDALEQNVGVIDAIAKNHFQTHWNNCKEVRVYALAKKFTFSSSCKLMLNIQDPQTVNEFHELFNCLLAGLFSLPVNLPGTKFSRGIRASKEICEKFEEMIRHRKTEVMEKKNLEGKDVLSRLVLEKYKNGEEIIEWQVASQMTGIIVPSFEGAGATMASVIKYLAELPEIYEGVLREQMEIANSKGPGELLNYGDIMKMRYSWNVAREVLRLQPPDSGAFREAITDFNLNGFLIAKGWKIRLAVHAAHKNPEYFPEPEKFDPSRFEGNELVPFSYVPFGGGPSICPGREFARLQILVFMHNVITKFRWEKVFPDEQMIMDPILMPAKGLPIRLYPHQPSII